MGNYQMKLKTEEESSTDEESSEENNQTGINKQFPRQEERIVERVQIENDTQVTQDEEPINNETQSGNKQRMPWYENGNDENLSEDGKYTSHELRMGTFENNEKEKTTQTIMNQIWELISVVKQSWNPRIQKKENPTSQIITNWIVTSIKKGWKVMPKW